MQWRRVPRAMRLVMISPIRSSNATWALCVGASMTSQWYMGVLVIGLNAALQPEHDLLHQPHWQDLHDHHRECMAIEYAKIRKLAIKKEKKQTTNAFLVSNIHVEETSPMSILVNQTTQSEVSKKEATLLLPNAPSCFRELHVCPSDIKNVPNS
jgi:hypothetical protein